MIRKLEKQDVDRVMSLWLDTNIRAHHFIDAAYWQGNYELVKGMLPEATVMVYEEDNDIQGFIGLMDGYIAGIFVDANHQSKGIGRALLQYAKEHHGELSLQVYQKNTRAVTFYKREQFAIGKEQVDEHTCETELVMSWKKDG